MRFHPQHLILLLSALALAWALGPSLVADTNEPTITRKEWCDPTSYSPDSFHSDTCAQTPGPADSTGVLVLSELEPRP